MLKSSRDPSVKTSAEAIEETASRAAGLTRLLLAFGRRQKIEARDVDVNAVVRDVEPLLRRFAGENHLTVELGSSLRTVRIDPMQLQQVLLNLVGNARDAMAAAGTVTVRTAMGSAVQLGRAPGWSAPSAGAVALEVIDTGAGMSAEVKARVFEPFFTTKLTGQGTGIGLATVREIVEQAGGIISVESEPGKGASFTIFLPVHSSKTG
jgi:signal transduction histidine kinase